MGWMAHDLARGLARCREGGEFDRIGGREEGTTTCSNLLSRFIAQSAPFGLVLAAAEDIPDQAFPAE
jgi:hypothetical protein